MAQEHSEQFGCNRSMQTSAWQCWPLCSICSDQRLVPPQKNFRGTQSTAKRKVVGVKRNQGQLRVGWWLGAWCLAGGVVAEALAD
jgi:hypothetical protein